MFCPNCGAENTSGSFCKNCGTQLTYPSPVTSADTIPAKNKSDFLKNYASQKCKKNALISLILTFVLIFAMVGSYFLVMGTSVEKLPLISFSAKMSDEDAVREIGKFKLEIKDRVARGRTELQREKQNFTQSEYDLLDKLFDKAEDCSKNSSFSNLKKFYKVAEEISNKTKLTQKVNFANATINDINEAKEILNIVSVVLLCCISFVLFFSALGGLLKVRGLVIVGMIFALVYSLILCPVWALVLIMALYVALIVFISMVNSQYKEYKRRCLSNK